MPLDTKIRQTLRQIVETYQICNGDSESIRRCRALLLDLAGDQRLAVNLLIQALELDAPHGLRSGSSPALAQGRLVAAMQETYGTSEENARWAVESWHVALGLPLPATPPPSPAPVDAAEKARQEAEAQAKREALQRSSAPALSPAAQRIGIELVRIPAGEFLYGDNKKKRTLPEFWIARTPVTVAQFAAFVEATKYMTTAEKQGSAWNYVNSDWKVIKEANWRQPHGPGSGGGKEKHPVTCVNWGDAVAFCEWAGVRLTTGEEWEKAARGTDGREYPWGNEAPDAKRCNSNGNVGDTTPVGAYPAGANGLFDMAGNVSEWCANDYSWGKELRGGAWSSSSNDVRCASEGWPFPGYRLDDWGFRVVGVGVPPQPSGL